MKPTEVKLPAEKRFDIAPARENDQVVFMSPRLQSMVERKGLPDPVVQEMGVTEYTRDTDHAYSGESAEDQGVRIHPGVEHSADAYLELVALRRELRSRIQNAERVKQQEQQTGIKGMAGIFDAQTTGPQQEMPQLRKRHQAVSRWLQRMRGATMDAWYAAHGERKPGEKASKQPKQEHQDDLLQDYNQAGEVYMEQGEMMPDVMPYRIADVPKRGKEMLYGLARRGDARRKFTAYEREQASLQALEQKIDIIVQMIRLRQQIEDAKAASKRSVSVPQLVTEQYGLELKKIIDALMRSGVMQKPDQMPEAEYRAHIGQFVMSQLEVPSDLMRQQLEEKQKYVVEKRTAWQEMLQDARHAELAEFIAEHEIKDLLELYHVQKKRFIPVGEIKRELEELDQIVTTPNGPILRAFLYGPPGTGKTESLREIGNRHGQRVRVISLHETSTFETLVGMHQIPLPKAETIGDAERFWETIKSADPAQIIEAVPQEVLEPFAGKNFEQKASDFKRWFGAQLKAARVIAALGAVSPDDPRVRKATQAALAAWLDQPLAEGLMRGDLVILDEADRAGNALEGLQDLLTRKPGDIYQPPGRPEPMRIHPDARVVMTANWGDVQTEFSGGSGRLAAPIASRVVEKRKVNYLDPGTEMQLFEIMTSAPDGKSLLTKSEHQMAECLIQNIFPRLRDFYLNPGELQFLTPMSVRTLENIKRRIIDETTRTRVRNNRGELVHLVEAAWHEVASGPFRDDQRERIMKELAKIFSDSGIFNHLPEIKDVAKHQVAASIMRLPGDEVKAFMGEPCQGAVVMGWQDKVSLGAYLEQEDRAQNSALRKTQTYRSPQKKNLEAQREWEHEMEDRGANPETQRAMDRIIHEWPTLIQGCGVEDLANPEKKLQYMVRTLTEKIKAERITEADVAVFAERFKEMEVDREMGLLLSLMIHRMITSLPESERLNVECRLNLEGLGTLDYLGYRLPGGTLILKNGAVGDYAARECSGGTIIIECDGVGDKLAYGMRSGIVTTRVAGKRACQRMKGGEVTITESAGDRLCMEMQGGTVHAKQAGRFVGQRMSGLLKIETAQDRLGEELQAEGCIEVQQHSGLGKNIQGTVIYRGAPVISKGEKLKAA